MELEMLRVLIVADDPLARAGLATLLAERETLTVVGQVAGEDALFTHLDVYRPDVIVWDLGWDVTELPPTFGEVDKPVLALLPHEELVPAARGAGAQGLLLRDGDGELLELALQAVAHGLLLLAPALADSVETRGLGATEPPAELPRTG